MNDILNLISLLFIPALITFILVFGMIRKVPVYDDFIAGAKEGLNTAIGIVPFIIGIFIAIRAMTSSGAMEFLEKLLAPVLGWLKIPEELTSLILLRPISGSGSLVVIEEIIRQNGADSFVGRAGSVMVGSCETVFYVLAIYFGVTAVKNMRHALPVGIWGYVISVIASVLVCMYI